MEFNNIIQVETLRYLIKITTLQRKANRYPQVLAAKYTASLQLLYIVGGDLADPRTVAKCFFLRGGGSYSSRHDQLHSGEISNSVRASNLAWLPLTIHSNCSERLYLAVRTLLLKDLKLFAISFSLQCYNLYQILRGFYPYYIRNIAPQMGLYQHALIKDLL